MSFLKCKLHHVTHRQWTLIFLGTKTKIIDMMVRDYMTRLHLQSLTSPPAIHSAPEAPSSLSSSKSPSFLLHRKSINISLDLSLCVPQETSSSMRARTSVSFSHSIQKCPELCQFVLVKTHVAKSY